MLADISGSVATFAAFALQLTYALRSEFSRVRSFVFMDGLDEVTSILAESDTIMGASQRINEEGLGVWLNGHSDYGNALDTFWQRFGEQINSRSIVLILGDARTNYHATRAGIVGDIRRRAADVFWLNPESKTMWDTGDSIIGRYGEHCSGVFEFRNLKQLGAFVEQLA
ncbi:VWA domain-containing protein [Rhodococcus sp. OK302]|uniref:VWA domain-containing protein n=1 Tax=Rhodococcus sp. OK302 TaxID=1882769 RepID=UPI0020CF84EB|nr:VWA domain-containing protein [Rhodococcus sp. OK302]